MLRSLSFKARLTAGLGVVVACMLIGTLYSISLIRGLTAVVAGAARIHQVGKLAQNSTEMAGLSRAIVLHSIFDDKVKVEEFKKQFEASSRSFRDIAASVGGAASESDKSILGNLQRTHGEWLALHNEVIRLLASQQVDVAETKVADPAFISKADEIRRLAEEMSANEAEKLSRKAASANTQSLIGSVALVVISVAVGLFVLLYVRRTGNELLNLTSSLASNSGEVARLSKAVRSASESLAQGSSQQAAGLADTVNGRVKSSNQTLEEMVASMEAINTSSATISKIIKVIDGIAFQTNILPLNAAVEAARAGAAGAGFAVVADEVRNLAQRSAQAARDTAQLIEESISTSQGGSVRLQQLTEGIRAITGDSSRVNVLVNEVNLGSQEQARGIEQIARAVSEMDRGTQGASASARESAASSVELLEKAEELHHIVLKLRGVVGSRTE